MNLRLACLRAAAALLLLGPVAGCRHKAAAPPPPPPPAPAPAPAPAPITVVTPLPSLPPESKPTNVQPSQPDQPAPAALPARQRLKRKLHRTKPPVADAETPAAKTSASAPAQAAKIPVSADGVVPSPPGTPGQSYNSTAAEEAAPALGQLSTGTAISQPAKLKTIEETDSLEARLLRLKQAASQEAASVRMQVQVFLKRAREAAAESDLDGAQTLNTKARVLLSELETQ